MKALLKNIAQCQICAPRFAKTHSAHSPRPVVVLSKQARILIVGQAPGARVHESGRPFTDPSGDRLREWMGVDESTFYNQDKIAILPMAFCFPGYNAAGSDLPPPAICAKTWRKDCLDAMPQVALTLVIGGYAQKYHLGTQNVTQTVASWRDYAPNAIALPHPSWRNTGWIKKHPWFESELVPYLQKRIAEELA